MTDLTEVADDIDGLADREFKAGGFKFTFASVAAIFAFISTIVGGLYGGFVLYQKIEEVAGLDLGAYQQQMEVMDAKVSQSRSTLLNTLETLKTVLKMIC